MKKRKIVSVLLAAMLTATVFAGCNNQGTESGTPSGDNPTSSAGEASEDNSGEAKELSLWYYWESEHQQKVLSEMIDDFTASQSNITVEAEYIPFADFKKQLSIGATAEELPDMVIIDSPDHASYASMGIFADITDKTDVSAYFEGPINSCTLDGKLYGLPFGSNCLGLFYNEDLMGDQKVPTTWDELSATAKALTTDTVSGLAFCALQNEEGTFNFMPWVWSTGTDSFHINNEDGIRALSFIGGLVSDGAMTKESINWTQGDVMNQFISGNVAMMVNGPWQVPAIREQAPDLNWNVALIPKDKEYASDLGGENFAIINNDNVEASIEFLEFVTSPENLAGYLESFGYIAARQDVADGQFEGDEITGLFVEQMQYAQPRGPHAQWPEISDAISLAFNETITQTSTPEAAAEKAQSTIDGILAE